MFPFGVHVAEVGYSELRRLLGSEVDVGGDFRFDCIVVFRDCLSNLRFDGGDGLVELLVSGASGLGLSFTVSLHLLGHRIDSGLELLDLRLHSM